MAVSIDATVGGASSNAFDTLANTSTYLEGRLNSSLWDAASTDSKNRAIVEATRELTGKAWKGTRVNETQALDWPRQWVENPDAPWSGVWYYETTVIPQRVKDAMYELALEFVKAGTTDIAALPANDGVIQKTVDVLSTTWASPSERQRGLARFPRAMTRIAPLIESVAGRVTMVRG